MKLPKLKGKLRRPQNASQRRSLAARDFYRRQQRDKSSNGTEFIDSELWMDSESWED